MYWFNYEIVTGSQRKTSRCLQCLQSIHPKQNQKQTMHKCDEWIMHASNWNKKPIKVLKVKAILSMLYDINYLEY